MKRKLFLLVNVLTLSLSSLTYAQTVPMQEIVAIQQEEGIQLTREQMIEDYHYMWGVIEDSYPFLGVVATPNSGIVFKFSVLYTVNEDGRNNEEFGTSPDHAAVEGETPLQACLKLIKKK